MTKTIAISGKGGTGKTSIAALLIDLLKQKGVVLAIDGDPSSNLHMALGLPLRETIGAIRESLHDRKMVEKTGMAKPDYIMMRIQESLVESKGMDLLAMGRPEGPGCYCAANNWLRESIDRLSSNYDYVVIDNEAGMEHISRQTTRDVNLLLLVSEPTIRGITAAARMKELIGELRAHVDRITLVLNRVKNGIPEEIAEAIDKYGLELISTLPEDPSIASIEVKGAPLTDLPDDAPMKKGVADLARKLELV